MISVTCMVVGNSCTPHHKTERILREPVSWHGVEESVAFPFATIKLSHYGFGRIRTAVTIVKG